MLNFRNKMPIIPVIGSNKGRYLHLRGYGISSNLQFKGSNDFN